MSNDSLTKPTSYIIAQLLSKDIESIVINADIYDTCNGDRFNPIMLENGRIYVEYYTEGVLKALFDFWRIDEIHYVQVVVE